MLCENNVGSSTVPFYTTKNPDGEQPHIRRQIGDYLDGRLDNREIFSKS